MSVRRRAYARGSRNDSEMIRPDLTAALCFLCGGLVRFSQEIDRMEAYFIDVNYLGCEPSTRMQSVMGVVVPMLVRQAQHAHFAPPTP